MTADRHAPVDPAYLSFGDAMFTGLVEEQGRITALEPRADGVTLTIAASVVMSDAELGASIAVNGCCLTVTTFDSEWWTADAVPETMDRTNLGELKVGDYVNLERPMAAGARLGGHIVQGHVDGTGAVAAITPLDDGSFRYRFTLPTSLSPYVVEKGSIAVDGISLTVAAVGDDFFEIAIIPHTAAVTNLGARAVGETVNLEVDVLAKYVERQVEASVAHHMAKIQNEPQNQQTASTTERTSA